MKKTFIIIFLLSLVFIVFAGNAKSEDKKPIVIQSDCAGCGDCQTVCPVKAITVSEGKAVIDTEKCINCKLCLTTCTFGAIK